MRLRLAAAALLLPAPGASLGIRSPEPVAEGGRAVHLISFGSCSDDPDAACSKMWREKLQQLSEAAANISAITHHHLFNGFPAAIENDPRWAKHIEVGVRGRGYWFYKAALVNLLWSDGTLKDGDVAVWCDASAFKHPFLGREVSPRWEAVLELPLWDVFVMEQFTKEHEWTKGDIFDRFGVQWNDPHYGLTHQPRAQFWMAWLNPRTRTFMRHWEDLKADFHLVSDEASVSANSESFHENRHDQSLLSMLMKSNSPDLRKNWSMAPWQRHKVYGIPGLAVKAGWLPDEAPGVKAAAPARGPPVRRIFAGGSWSELPALALQPAAAPPACQGEAAEPPLAGRSAMALP